jgi:hypothetical protein
VRLIALARAGRLNRLMRGSRAVVPVLSALALTAASLAAVGVPAAMARPAGSAPNAPAASKVIGHLAYLTNSFKLELVSVRANGSTSSPQQLAPTLASTKNNQVNLGQVVASPDGRWLAWSEFRANDSKPLLVLRHNSTGKETKLRTSESPVGFAGDTLLTEFNAVQRLVLKPTPHFVLAHHARNPLTGYPGGVVNETLSNDTKDSKLLLTTFAGHHTVLHRYTDAGPKTYRLADQAWVSADGKHLAIERGNHQDFDGLGPSSLVDEFSLHGSHTRHTLGTYSPTAAGSSWRVTDLAYVGAKDQVWVAWERATAKHAVTLVASYSGGKWHLQHTKAITVAGNRAGDVVIQPGKYVKGKAPEGFPTEHATSNALLRHGSKTSTLGVKGIQFFWVSG